MIWRPNYENMPKLPMAEKINRLATMFYMQKLFQLGRPPLGSRAHHLTDGRPRGRRRRARVLVRGGALPGGSRLVAGAPGVGAVSALET